MSTLSPLYIRAGFHYFCSANITETYNPQAVILVSLVLKFQLLRHWWNLVVVGGLCRNQEEIQSDSLSTNNFKLLPTQRLVQEMMTERLQEVIRERQKTRLNFPFSRVFLLQLCFFNYIVDTSAVSRASFQQARGAISLPCGEI